MNLNKNLAIMTALSVGVLTGCGKKSTVGPLVNAELSMNMLSVSSSSALSNIALNNYQNTAFDEVTKCSTNDLSSRPFEFQDGAAGPAETVKILLKKIALKVGTASDSGSTTLFESATGVELSLANGKVDMSEIELSTEINAGEYNYVVLTVGDLAIVKGCITGTKNSMESCSSDNETCEPLGDEFDEDDGTFNFCTKAAYGIDTLAQTKSASLSRSVYSGGTAEETKVLLKRSGVGNALSIDANGFTDYEFRLPSAVTVAEGSDLTISMLLDLNIFLKFDFNNRDYVGNTNGGSEMYSDMTDKAYFFSETLDQAGMVFVGDAGSIEGYDVYICVKPNDQFSVARNWLTLIFDANDKLIAGMTRTFDPTGLVALNGTIGSEDAATRAPTKTGNVYTIPLKGFPEGAGNGLLDNFVRKSAVNEFGYIAFGEAGTQTSMSATTEGSANFDWHYTLKHITDPTE